MISYLPWLRINVAIELVAAARQLAIGVEGWRSFYFQSHFIRHVPFWADKRPVVAESPTLSVSHADIETTKYRRLDFVATPRFKVQFGNAMFAEAVIATHWKTF